MRDVWVARKPPGFAFVEMEDRRDAQVTQVTLSNTDTDDRHKWTRFGLQKLLRTLSGNWMELGCVATVSRFVVFFEMFSY